MNTYNAIFSYEAVRGGEEEFLINIYYHKNSAHALMPNGSIWMLIIQNVMK